jgi:nitrogen fixation NifU-like protein
MKKHGDLNAGMYREQIMELYRNPDNYGSLKNATHRHREYNSSCGDEITMHLIVKGNKVKDARFSGSGCVMSVVSSALLTEKIKGMNVEDIRKMGDNDVLGLIRARVSPGRMKCVLLPLTAIKGAFWKNA